MLQINESYDNSKVKCLLYDSKKAEFVLINNFKLHFDKSKKDTKPITPTSPQALPLKNIVSLGNKTAQKSKPGKKGPKLLFSSRMRKLLMFFFFLSLFPNFVQFYIFDFQRLPCIPMYSHVC